MKIITREDAQEQAQEIKNKMNMAFNTRPTCSCETCPDCGGLMYHYDTDECEFAYDGTGHYYEDMYCESCYAIHRVCYDFEYVVTKCFLRGTKGKYISLTEL